MNWTHYRGLKGVSSMKIIRCIGLPEPFLSVLQDMGVEFLHGVENFHQGKVLFVQAAYNFLHAAKMYFMHL